MGEVNWHQKLRRLGLKNIQYFNTTLLAKQIWRFITKLELLVSKILLAKYFEKKSFFEATTPRRLSWFWQSIMFARDLIETRTLKSRGVQIDLVTRKLA